MLSMVPFLSKLMVEAQRVEVVGEGVASVWSHDKCAHRAGEWESS